jgi:hypothetical protein
MLKQDGMPLYKDGSAAKDVAKTRASSLAAPEHLGAAQVHVEARLLIASPSTKRVNVTRQINKHK